MRIIELRWRQLVYPSSELYVLRRYRDTQSRHHLRSSF